MAATVIRGGRIVTPGGVVDGAGHRGPDGREDDRRDISVHPDGLPEVVVVELPVLLAPDHDALDAENPHRLADAVVRVLAVVHHGIGHRLPRQEHTVHVGVVVDH